jgi:hypothetical protein
MNTLIELPEIRDVPDVDHRRSRARLHNWRSRSRWQLSLMRYMHSYDGLSRLHPIRSRS